MKIGELAARADLAPSAIRYYEKVGLLASAERIHGQRRYPSDALDGVLLIRVAGEMDFTLAEIKLFLNGFHKSTPVSARWRKLTSRKIAELQQRLAFTRVSSTTLSASSIAAVLSSIHASLLSVSAPASAPSAIPAAMFPSLSQVRRVGGSLHERS
jgi:MerR family redox-sensitive transcriptional activator SoxR